MCKLYVNLSPTKNLNISYGIDLGYTVGRFDEIMIINLYRFLRNLEH